MCTGPMSWKPSLCLQASALLTTSTPSTLQEIFHMQKVTLKVVPANEQLPKQPIHGQKTVPQTRSSTTTGIVRANTVLSGAEERGVDGPSLARSYFSRLQPISFLFSDPSSSHIAELVARTWRYSISMLHTHATHAGPGKRLKCSSTRRRGVVSKSAMPLIMKKSSSQQTLFALVLNSIFQPGVVLIFRKIPAWPFFGKPFFGTRHRVLRRNFCQPAKKQAKLANERGVRGPSPGKF